MAVGDGLAVLEVCVPLCGWLFPSTTGALFWPELLPDGYAVALGEDDADGSSPPELGEALGDALGDAPLLDGVVVPVGETWATRRKRSSLTSTTSQPI